MYWLFLRVVFAGIRRNPWTDGGHQHLAVQTGLLVTPGGFVSRNGCFIRRRVGSALRDLVLGHCELKHVPCVRACVCDVFLVALWLLPFFCDVLCYRAIHPTHFRRFTKVRTVPSLCLTGWSQGWSSSFRDGGQLCVSDILEVRCPAFLVKLQRTLQNKCSLLRFLTDCL